MELSEPREQSGPIPLPPVKLPAFITGMSEQPGDAAVPPKPSKRRPWAEGTPGERKGGVQAKGVVPALDGGLLTLFEDFCALTPGSKDSVIFLKQLPKKLVTLGEGVGHGALLRKDSFLWNAWRHAWLHALSKLLFSSYSLHPTFLCATESVHKADREIRNMVGIALMASYMLQSHNYERFRIVGWPVGLQLPISVATVDGINFPAHLASKDAICSWYSYRLIYAMYAGTRGHSDSERILLRFEPVTNPSKDMIY